jgi:glucose-6-phosphate 1-epimerase
MGDEGSLSKVVLVARDGARAEAYLHGAHVTSWIPAEGTERLFLSTRSAFRPGVAIRGGVPVIFPQFASEGPLPKHGFARTAEWELVSADDPARAVFRLSSSQATRAIWPHDFVAELSVTIHAQTLELALRVDNTGSDAFHFTAALHTYLRVEDVRETFVRGLTGHTYRDSTAGGAQRVEAAERVEVQGEINRIYFDVDAPLTVEEPARPTRVEMDGFTDVVVWNPGAAGSVLLADMEPEGHLRMVCVEAASIGTPVTIAPGGTWTGRQRLVAS